MWRQQPLPSEMAALAVLRQWNEKSLVPWELIAVLDLGWQVVKELAGCVGLAVAEESWQS